MNSSFSLFRIAFSASSAKFRHAFEILIQLIGLWFFWIPVESSEL